MKQLIEKIKTRKLLSIMTLIAIISTILGILIISILSQENKDLITTTVANFFNAIKKNQINYNDILFKSMSNNLILDIIVWLLGISIIGIPIILVILSFKSLIFSFTFTSILYTYRFKGIIYAIIYIIPHALNLFIIFVLAYYSLSFSYTLFNYLFRKKECNRKILVKRYLKLLVLSIVLLIITALLETYLIPFLLRVI